MTAPARPSTSIKDNMRRTTRSLAAAGLLLLGVLGGAALFAPTRPPIVATVDLEKVYNSLDAQSAADAALEKLAQEMQAEQSAKRDELTQLQAELDNFNPGSPAHRALMSKIEEKVVLFQVTVEYDRQKIEARRADYIRQLYQEIKSTLRTLSEENSWDIVFLDDSIPPLEFSDPQRTMQQISARRMLYCNSSLDVTALLVARMNANFAARGGAAAKGGVPAPAGGAAPGGAPAGGAGQAAPATGGKK